MRKCGYGNRANPGHDRLAALAKLCHVSFEWLATGRGTMKLDHDPVDQPPAAFGKLVDDPQSIRLLRAWNNLSARSRLAVLELIESVAAMRRPRRAGMQPVIKLEAGYFDPETGLPFKAKD